MSIENMRKLIDEHDKTVANLPRINTMHMQEVKEFLTQYADIRTEDDANRVLGYFNSIKKEWSSYYHVDPLIYPQIYHSIANAYEILEDTNTAINELKECLSIIEAATEYQWLFQIKANLYFHLATLNYRNNNLDETRSNMRIGIYHLLTRYNNIYYDNFAFYAFHPLNDYVLEGIRDNKISLSDPCRFNDPMDPALITHFKMWIEQEQEEAQKELLQIQQDIYKEIRITCLSRAQPLPIGELSAPPEKDPPFDEINKATMWGYYANSHKGICIKYIFPRSFTDHDHQRDNEVLVLRNVTYAKQYNPQKDNFNFDEAFFTKGSEWEHEGECRLVLFKKNGNVPEFPWIPLPKGCIREIYIGYAASIEDKKKLQEALNNKPEIKLYQMQLSQHNILKLEPVEITLEEL